jgi:hypothetical protein
LMKRTFRAPPHAFAAFRRLLDALKTATFTAEHAREANLSREHWRPFDEALKECLTVTTTIIDATGSEVSDDDLPGYFAGGAERINELAENLIREADRLWNSATQVYIAAHKKTHPQAE